MPSHRDKTAPNPRLDANRRRNLKVARRVLSDGKTYGEVASEFSITRERVRSILHDVRRAASKLPPPDRRPQHPSVTTVRDQNELAHRSPEGREALKCQLPPEMPAHDCWSLAALREHRDWWLLRFDALELAWGLTSGTAAPSVSSTEAPSTLGTRLQQLVDAFQTFGGLPKVAAIVDRAEHTVKRWLKDEGEPVASDLRALCDATGANIEWLVYGVGGPRAFSALMEYVAMEYHHREYEQLGEECPPWRHCTDARREQLRNAAHSSFLSWIRSEHGHGPHARLLLHGRSSNDGGRDSDLRI